MNTAFRYPPLILPVLSNEYEIARQLLQSMLQNGSINRQEYERIDAANMRTFIGAAGSK